MFWLKYGMWGVKYFQCVKENWKNFTGQVGGYKSLHRNQDLHFRREQDPDQMWLCTSVISAVPGVEIRTIMIQFQARQKDSKTPSQPTSWAR
jgi:hypothetical protein